MFKMKPARRNELHQKKQCPEFFNAYPEIMNGFRFGAVTDQQEILFKCLLLCLKIFTQVIHWDER